MIEGLKVTIKGEELRKLCLSRAEFHENRAKLIEQQKQSLSENEGEDHSSDSTFSNKGPEDLMRDKIRRHRSQAAELTFYADHLVLTEDYFLDASDLSKLGITPSY